MEELLSDEAKVPIGVYTTIAIALKRLTLRAFCPLRLAQHRPDPVEPSFSVWCFHASSFLRGNTDFDEADLTVEECS
jgi:hypothetical protein